MDTATQSKSSLRCLISSDLDIVNDCIGMPVAILDLKQFLHCDPVMEKKKVVKPNK